MEQRRNNMWKVIIEKHNNGYKVDYRGGDINDSAVFEDKSGVEPNKEHVVSMLYDILDYLDETGSKHDKKRLFIEWRDNE